MDFRQLEFFVAVAEERNFTRAAERSFVSQPGLSASIRALEREIGTRLFIRGRTGATLTRAGQAFLPRAVRMLADAHAAQLDLADTSGTSPRSVRIGAEQCIADLLDMPDLLDAFAQRHPAAGITFEHASTAQLNSLVETGELDLAVVAGLRAEGRVAPGSGETVLRQENFVLLVPPSHRLAERTSTAWSDLAGDRFVEFAPTWAARQVLDVEGQRRGIEREASATVADVHMLLSLVARNFGIAVVPESIAAKPEATGLSALGFERGDVGWEIRLRVAERAGVLAHAFAAMLIPHRAVAEARREIEDMGAISTSQRSTRAQP